MYTTYFKIQRNKTLMTKIKFVSTGKANWYLTCNEEGMQINIKQIKNTIN